jgi:2,3-bisphosphoglycerate-dependent phosphoglycerate mutase
MTTDEQKSSYEPSGDVFATLVFVRHGQSEWNASNRFTGWVDIGLTELGVQEAKEGAMEIKKAGFQFDCLYTSYLKRAILTANLVLEEIDQLYIPVFKSWRLNERMYGGLQGLNKVDTVNEHGKEQVLKWRRSFDIPPPEIDDASEFNPRNDPKYRKIDTSLIPKTECLKDVIVRALPYWESDIKPALAMGGTICVAAHGNSIRAIVKYLDSIEDSVIPSLEIPTGIPLVYEFNKELQIIKNAKSVAPLTGVFLGDPARILAAQQKVKNQVSQQKK